MAIFKADPAKKMANDLGAARANCDKLIERLAAAEALVLERRAAAKDLARDGASDRDLDLAESELRKAQDRVSTLSAALEETRQQIAALENEQADLADRKLRAATAAAIEERAIRLEASAAAIDAAFAEFTAVTAAAAEISLDGKGLAIFAVSARGEIPPAVAMVVRELRNRAAATLAGTAPAALPTQPPQAVAPPLPPPISSYFSLQNLKFVDAQQGQQRRVPRFMIIELTERQAANGLRAEIVCKLDDPRVQQLRQQAVTQQPPEAWHCYDIDSSTPPTNDPQLMARHSSKGSGLTVFERFDRGPPRTMTVPAAPAAASRSLKSEESDE
jgi:hypothetical protein